MKIVLRAAGIIVAFGLLIAMAWASTAPLRVATSDDAILRLSLGARPERIETCRTQSDEELEKLAPQMRQRVICEGVTARYRLSVRRNGQLLHEQVVRGGGLRRDRRLYVSRDLHVRPGPGLVAVDLVRIDTVVARGEEDEDEDEDEEEEEHERREHREREDELPGVVMPGRRQREAEERERRRVEDVPAELHLEIEAVLEPREVLLVTYDPVSRRLVSTQRDRGK
ncbi:MAG TPA: hypothetical protein VFH14_05535 [Gemmatimonadaceae bacterium]|nr:hypothetical protein [Gemmatimonadaceae bacterium]